MPKKIIINLLLLSLLTGCATASRTVFFTLRPVPNKTLYSTNIDIKGVTSDIPNEKRMLYTVTDNGFVFDDYNYWMQSPAALTTNFFKYCLNSINGQKEDFSNLILTGNIISIQCDMKSKEVSVEIDIKILEKGKSDIVLQKIYNENIKIDKLTASNYASAVSELLYKICTEIVNDINNLKTRV